MPRGSRLTAALVVPVLIVTAGCSSSGGGGTGVSNAQLTAKLNKDPQIKQLEAAAGSNAGKVKSIISCIAVALNKDADPSDVKNYVAGKMNLNDLGGKSKGSANKASADVQKCARQKVG